MSRHPARHTTDPRLRRRRRRPAALVVCAVALLLVAGTVGPAWAAAGVDAHSARTCSAPRYPGSGYFTSLTVRHVGCATGRRLTLAHYRCRTRSGPAGRCHKRVRGYTCRERRNAIPTEIDARVTCRRGAKTVIYTYQQNT
jgi:hypothetical protein